MVIMKHEASIDTRDQTVMQNYFTSAVWEKASVHLNICLAWSLYLKVVDNSYFIDRDEAVYRKAIACY